jgi:ABC-type amino acid transport substrate-binding protein
VKALRPVLLAGITLVAGVLAWAGSQLWNSLGSLPGIPTAAPIVLAIIAMVLGGTALSLRSRLKAQRERVPGAKGVDPLSAARALVLGQASALVSALVTGIYGGMGVYLVTQWGSVSASKGQSLAALLAVLAGIAVMAAGLWIQHICRLPDDPDTPAVNRASADRS